MTDNVENLILGHLKHIRNKVDVISLELQDLKSRASATEEMLGQVLVLIGGQGKRMDRFDERLARIEKRLDLEHA
jgi:archaellum component FlaC